MGKEAGITGAEGYSPIISKGAMREYFRKEQAVRKRSNLRLIIIMMVLFFIAYLILFR